MVVHYTASGGRDCLSILRLLLAAQRGERGRRVAKLYIYGTPNSAFGNWVNAPYILHSHAHASINIITVFLGGPYLNDVCNILGIFDPLPLACIWQLV